MTKGSGMRKGGRMGKGSKMTKRGRMSHNLRGAPYTKKCSSIIPPGLRQGLKSQPYETYLSEASQEA